nr:hypothetical protein CFP56_70136 [Quercus suber]
MGRGVTPAMRQRRVYRFSALFGAGWRIAWWRVGRISVHEENPLGQIVPGGFLWFVCDDGILGDADGCVDDDAISLVRSLADHDQSLESDEVAIGHPPLGCMRALSQTSEPSIQTSYLIVPVRNRMRVTGIELHTAVLQTSLHAVRDYSVRSFRITKSSRGFIPRSPRSFSSTPFASRGLQSSVNLEHWRVAVLDGLLLNLDLPSMRADLRAFLPECLWSRQ